MNRTRSLLLTVVVLAVVAALPGGEARASGTLTGMAAMQNSASGSGTYGALLIPGCQWAPWAVQCGNLGVYGNGLSLSDTGCGPPNGCTFGPEFQCTELAQRYAYFQWGEPATWDGYGGAQGYAYQMWNAGPALPIGLQQFPNGAGTPPQVGDLLVFNQGWVGSYWDGTGHVAIVSAVSMSSVDIVQQNGTSTGRDSLPLSGSTVTASGYPPLIGWLHNPVTSTAGRSRLAAADAGSQQIVFWSGGDGHLREAWESAGAWSGPIDWTQAWNVGTVLYSAPAVAVTPSGRQDVFWRGPGGDLYSASWSGSWTAPTDLSASWPSPSPLVSAPAVAVDGAGDEVVFWQGVSGDLMEIWSTPSGGWTAPSDWSGGWTAAQRLNSAPTVAITASHQQLVFWESATGHLMEDQYAKGWTGPVDVSLSWGDLGRLASAPSVTVTPAGREAVLWTGPDQRLWEAWYASSWNGPVQWNSGGTIQSAPAALVSPTGVEMAYWQAPDGDLASSLSANSWSSVADWSFGWSSGAMLSSSPATAVTPSGQQLVFWRGANDHLWESWYQNGWQGPVDWSNVLPGAPLLASAPSVAVTPDGSQQLVFWRSPANDLVEAWFSAGTWHGPVDWSSSWKASGTVASSPALAITPDGSQQLVFWSDPNGDLREAWYAAGSWNGPVDWTAQWGGSHPLASSPAVVTARGQQIVFWQDAAGHLVEAWFNGAWNGPVDWSTQGAPSMTPLTAPAVSMTAQGEQVLYWGGTGQHLDTAWWQGAMSAPLDLAAAMNVPAATAEAPSSALTPAGQRLLFWRGLNDHLQEAWSDGDGWSRASEATSVGVLA
ncbi:MAG: CHAP domain-containing protein [Candidatus Dormibacteria bacterium]